jgi:hypothetical protein
MNTPIAIDPVEYVLDAFDKLIAPAITGESELKKKLRTHLYRKLLVNLIHAELGQTLPTTIEDVYQLTIRCFDKLGIC